MKSNFRDRTGFPGTELGTTRRVPGSRKVSILGFLYLYFVVFIGLLKKYWAFALKMKRRFVAHIL